MTTEVRPMLSSMSYPDSLARYAEYLQSLENRHKDYSASGPVELRKRTESFCDAEIATKPIRTSPRTEGQTENRRNLKQSDAHRMVTRKRALNERQAAKSKSGRDPHCTSPQQNALSKNDQINQKRRMKKSVKIAKGYHERPVLPARARSKIVSGRAIGRF